MSTNHHETHIHPMVALEPVRRFRTPFARPQAICFQGERLWIGSIETRRIYALDPATFLVLEQIDAPGEPWGMTAVGDELRVLCGVTDEDTRLIFAVRDGAFQPDPIPCPDDTGSHLGFDGHQLYVSQWYRRRLLALDGRGRVLKTYDAPHGIAGHVIVGQHAYLLGVDDESAIPYWITELDLTTGRAADLGTLPLLARGLAHDGKLFWSNVREQGETIAFDVPR